MLSMSLFALQRIAEKKQQKATKALKSGNRKKIKK